MGKVNEPPFWESQRGGGSVTRTMEEQRLQEARARKRREADALIEELWIFQATHLNPSGGARKHIRLLKARIRKLGGEPCRNQPTRSQSNGKEKPPVETAWFDKYGYNGK